MSQTERVKKERTHSSRIRLYESVYKEYVGNVVLPEKKEKDKVKVEKKVKEENKKSINSYQLFVQHENRKKDKYKDLTGPERLATIAQAWEKKKRKERKEQKHKKELKQEREKEKCRTK